MSVDVSVAMITYNGGQYIREQLDSILAQTRRPDEIVVADDGSTDGTLAILDEYEEEYPSLFSVHEAEENLGVRRNRQRAVEHCTGDVLAFSDQDDVWCEDKIETQLAALEQDGVGVTFHNSRIVTNDGEEVGEHWELCDYRHGIARNPEDALEKLLLTNYVKGATIVMDADMVDQVLPFPEGWAPDYFIALLAASLGNLYDIDANLHRYRRHRDQESGHRTKSASAKILHGVGNYNPDLRKENAQRWHSLSARIQEIPDQSLAFDRERIIGHINARMQYDMNRANVYDPNGGILDGYRSIHNNFTRGYYSRFGTVSPALHLLKDAVACLVTSAQVK